MFLPLLGFCRSPVSLHRRDRYLEPCLLDARCCLGQWSVKLGLGCPLVHAYLGEHPKKLGLGMSGLGLQEPWSYCGASNTVPEGQGVCVSDLEVFVYMGSVTMPRLCVGLCMRLWVWGSVLTNPGRGPQPSAQRTFGPAFLLLPLRVSFLGGRSLPSLSWGGAS